jgi:anti-sigma B factor antagonist
MRGDQEHASVTLDFDARVVDDVPPTVIVRGEVDLATVDRFASALDTAIAAGGGGGILLDLRETTFLGSVGLSALLGAHQRLGRLAEAIVVRDPAPAVRRLFDLAGVGHLFTLRTTEPGEALARDRRGSGPLAGPEA